MNLKQQHFNWKVACGAIVAAAAWGITSPVRAASTINSNSDLESATSQQIAQVGVGSRINSPTPLNLRPRTHIPLPTNSRSRSYSRDRGYYPQYRRRSRHDEYGYGHHHDCDHHHGHHRRRDRRRGPIIIINPASSYSNYSSLEGYIRVIGK